MINLVIRNPKPDPAAGHLMDGRLGQTDVREEGPADPEAQFLNRLHTPNDHVIGRDHIHPLPHLGPINGHGTSSIPDQHTGLPSLDWRLGPILCVYFIRRDIELHQIIGHLPNRHKRHVDRRPIRTDHDEVEIVNVLDLSGYPAIVSDDLHSRPDWRSTGGHGGTLPLSTRNHTR
ncbi:hypothetical protein NITHO_3070019 [Nitrolancea hollandica Lb]|uniref:Uncharacterized protein n=1 Tax=Nitrolancea hollandica Lb TaxID=1129897 RepID=I4EHD1_9BACT|nr:hypothetical protein NITHO_3070019 [Nitrolancea hollandica Lb]